jgi:uncharacterized protein YkvS
LDFEDASVDARAEVCRTVIISELGRVDSSIMDILRGFVEKFNQSRIILDDQSDEALKDALMHVMKEVAVEEWETNPHFRQLLQDNFGPEIKDGAWYLLPEYFRYLVVLSELASVQTWAVDRTPNTK